MPRDPFDPSIEQELHRCFQHHHGGIGRASDRETLGTRGPNQFRLGVDRRHRRKPPGPIGRDPIQRPIGYIEHRESLNPEQPFVGAGNEDIDRFLHHIDGKCPHALDGVDDREDTPSLAVPP